MMYATIQFLNGLSYGLSLFLVAAGLSIIFGVLRVLNFAHGTFYMLGGYIAYEAVSHIGLSDGGFWIAVALSGLVLAVLAAVIERLMLRKLYGRDEIYQLLFTFALVLLLSDVIRAIWGTQVLSISFPPELRGAQNLGLAYYPRYRLFLCLVGIAVFFFMRSMVTLSAVIFLITPHTQVAAVSVLYLQDRGATNQAAAFSVCIIAIVVAALSPGWVRTEMGGSDADTAPEDAVSGMLRQIDALGESDSGRFLGTDGETIPW